MRAGENAGSRLLYLGFAFPPGVQGLYPERNPAGHALETQMISELRRHFQIRSAGVLPIIPPVVQDAQPDSGIAHEVLLLEKPPELFHRFRSLARLKAEYLRWRAAGWQPETILVYNLSPIYNQFLLWLRRQPDCPKLVLLLLDSANLGQHLPRLKRLRRGLKPMCIPDSEMIPHFDACVGLSRDTEHYFRRRQIPFLWMPGACTPSRALRPCQRGLSNGDNGPIRFGYFGALGAHSGIKPLISAFLSQDLPATLELCGYGKSSAELTSLARQDARLKFLGLLTPSECIEFGHRCDVLVNPRPASHGNENNFASKLFDYALSGRAILTSSLSGVEGVLGSEAFYFDPRQFNESLQERLAEIVSMPRAELHRRGEAIQQRIVSEFTWEKQAGRLAEFIKAVHVKESAVELTEALAA
ncbi:MAG TPA: glycosyltransferase [Verrucomicrobiae bacterium]|nr:glycosyltransferase [Verrucomicrobiae bacterium]